MQPGAEHSGGMIFRDRMEHPIIATTFNEGGSATDVARPVSGAGEPVGPLGEIRF